VLACLSFLNEPATALIAGRDPDPGVADRNFGWSLRPSFVF
jgi:hypothetical protein